MWCGGDGCVESKSGVVIVVVDVACGVGGGCGECGVVVIVVLIAGAT